MLWDSHPLTLGATPTQVFIDGISQIKNPHISKKSSALQNIPKTPDFSKEAKQTLEYDGLPPLEPTKAESDVVIFTNVSSVILRQAGGIHEVFSASPLGTPGVVVTEQGNIVCTGAFNDCPLVKFSEDAERINLHGGSISYVTFLVAFLAANMSMITQAFAH